MQIDYIISICGKKIVPKQDKFSYEYGKYDLPIEGSWAALSFVHGLCYGTFKDYVNYHHLYERAIEKLFNLKEIIYRWYNSLDYNFSNTHAIQSIMISMYRGRW